MAFVDLLPPENPAVAEAAESFTALRGDREVDVEFPPPHPKMRACVVVPARNEETILAEVVTALAEQRDLRGELLDAHDYEVLLLLNNCTDGTAHVARVLQRKFPRLALHIGEFVFPPDEAHVGRARQTLFDIALSRFQTLHRSVGLILTTDADSRPAPDWLVQNEAEIAAGADAVGGRITLNRAEKAALPSGVQRLFALDIGYRRALEELRCLYAPEAHDPFPRHHQHYGGSLAVTANAYARAGGMPLRRSREDVALYRAIIESGGRFRHSYRVRVHTSARMFGRAQGGLADAIRWWNGKAHDAAPVLVESAHAAHARLARLGLWCAENPGRCPANELTDTPEPPAINERAEIHATLCALRTINAELRPLSMAKRLDRARRRFPQWQ